MDKIFLTFQWIFFSRVFLDFLAAGGSSFFLLFSFFLCVKNLHWRRQQSIFWRTFQLTSALGSASTSHWRDSILQSSFGGERRVLYVFDYFGLMELSLYSPLQSDLNKIVFRGLVLMKNLVFIWFFRGVWCHSTLIFYVIFFFLRISFSSFSLLRNIRSSLLHIALFPSRRIRGARWWRTGRGWGERMRRVSRSCAGPMMVVVVLGVVMRVASLLTLLITLLGAPAWLRTSFEPLSSTCFFVHPSRSAGGFYFLFFSNQQRRRQKLF